MATNPLRPSTPFCVVGRQGCVYCPACFERIETRMPCLIAGDICKCLLCKAPLIVEESDGNKIVLARAEGYCKGMPRVESDTLRALHGCLVSGSDETIAHNLISGPFHPADHTAALSYAMFYAADPKVRALAEKALRGAALAL